MDAQANLGLYVSHMLQVTFELTKICHANIHLFSGGGGRGGGEGGEREGDCVFVGGGAGRGGGRVSHDPVIRSDI